MNYDKNEFELELKARGLTLTKQEVNKLMKLAVRQNSLEKAKPVLKKDKHFHYFLLTIAYIGAMDRFCELLEGSPLVKFLMKNRLNKARKLAIELKNEFHNVYKGNPKFIEAFDTYVEDFEDIIFIHLSVINNEIRGEEKPYGYE